MLTLLACAGPAHALVPLPAPTAGVPWPTREWPQSAPGPDVDGAALARALDAAFAEPGAPPARRTRAVLVVHRGRIVAERYAPGFDRDTMLPGWSIAKSLTNALCAILVREGRLHVGRPADVPGWRGPDDARARITIDQLLRMSSGLAWTERYDRLPSTVLQMLFGSGRLDMAAYAARQPPAAPADTLWYYSSGTSAILSGVIRRAFTSDADYHAFPRRALFERLGMRRTLFETDASGTIVGSSYVQTTARDLARFALLYLRDGVWEGERVLPDGWVDYTRTPTPTAPAGEYGAHFWLNAGVPSRGVAPPMRGVPDDALLAHGKDGQSVVIVPSRDLIVVRLGLTPDRRAWSLAAFIADVVAAFPR
jgi:CubicO group peptidase (beta-lactamase class C family)